MLLNSRGPCCPEEGTLTPHWTNDLKTNAFGSSTRALAAQTLHEADCDSADPTGNSLIEDL